MFDLLLSQCKQRVVSGLRSSRRTLKRCHHARWRTALKPFDVLIGSRWLWASPCMQHIRTRFRLAQVQSFSLAYWPMPSSRMSQTGPTRRCSKGLFTVCVGELAPSCCVSEHPPPSGAGLGLPGSGDILGMSCAYESHHMTRARLKGRAIASARWLISCLRYVNGSVAGVAGQLALRS